MKSLIRRWPAASYYLALLLVSWLIFGGVVGPTLVRGGPMQPMQAFMMFPILVLSVAIAGLWWAHVVQPGGAGDIWRRIRRWRVSAKWYGLALGLPPVAILTTLGVLGAISPAYHHGLFIWGVLFGLVPGILEEVGWMGYLFPRLLERFSTYRSALLLGALWTCWHLPVADFLGGAGPHGRYFLPFFLAFGAVLMAMRVVMVFIYQRTGSVLLMQLMHASSTGSLVLLGPWHITSLHEAIWYGAYAVVLWIAIGVAAVTGRLSSRSSA